ncbi:MAG: flagellin [Candidatus Poribacteria bacterium]|jgi:flagellin-like hook-associated protein FlgL
MPKVTLQTIGNNLKKRIELRLGALERAQMQLSTGLKVDKPSADPGRANRILDLKANIAQSEQFVSNTEHSEALMNVSNGAYQGVSDVLFRAQDLAHMAMSDTNSSSDYKYYAAEIGQLIESVLDMVNIDFAGTPLFAGTKTEGVAFETQRGSTTPFTRQYAILSDPSLRTLEVSAGDGSNFNDGDEIVLSSGDVSETVLIESIQTVGDRSVITVTGQLTRPYFVDGNAQISNADGSIVTPLTRDAAVGSLVLPLEQVLNTIESGQLIRIQDVDGGEDILVESVETDILENRAVIRLKHSLQRSYSIARGAEVLKNEEIGIGDIIGVRYTGDNGTKQERVGRNSFVPTGVPGSIVFQRVFDHLIDLRNAVRNGGMGPIGHVTRMLEHTTVQVTVHQTEVGARINRLHTMRSRLEDQIMGLKGFLQKVEEIDMTTALIEYQTQQALLSASLSTGSQLMASASSLLNMFG